MPYPTPPGTRIPFDLNDSAVLILDRRTGSWYEATDGEKILMSVERTGGIGISTSGVAEFGWQANELEQGAPTKDLTRAGVIVVLFPTPMRLTGLNNSLSWHYNSGSGSLYGVVRAEVWVSPDSTNGSDGTWTKIKEWDPNAGPLAAETGSELTAAFNGYSRSTLRAMPFNDGYRRPVSDHPMGFESLAGAVVRNVRAVRFAMWSPTASHLLQGFTPRFMFFGYPDTNALEERIEFWKSGSDARISADTLDWGDVPVSSTDQRSFRVKNMSSTKTADSVEISALPGASDSVPSAQDFLLFSLDETNWDTTVSFSSLSPETVSPVIYMRRIVPENAQLSNWAPRVVATVEEWT